MKQKKRSKLANIVWALPVASLILLAVLIVFSQIVVYTWEFNRQAEKLRNDYVNQQKVLIKQEVERVIDSINYQRSLSDQRTKDIIKQQVYEAYAVASSVYRQNKSNRSDSEMKRMVLEVLRAIRFEQGSGYFFAIRLDGLVTLNANKPELEGKNLLDLKDGHGRYFISNMVELARKSGEGFCEYYWVKPGSEGKDFKKISFIKVFEPFGWLIGTGLYVDDIEARTRKQMMGQINRIHFGENGYLFAGDWNGISLAHGAQPELIGTNMWAKSDSKGKKTTQLLIAASKKEGGGYVSYWWRRPSTGKESPKLAYARGVPEWHLFVATGVYLDDIEAHIAGLKALLKQELRHRIQITLLVAGIIIVCFLVLFYFINRRLLADINLFIDFFRQAVHDNKEIDRSHIRFKELYQAAGDANTMLREKTAVQEKLKELAVIAEQAVEGIIVAGFDNRLRFVNQSWADMHGYLNGDELLGRKLDIFHTREQLEKEVYPFNAEVRLHGRKAGEIGHMRRDGTTFLTWMQVTMLHDERGNPYAYLAFAEDITERKKTGMALVESERRYQTLFESANYSIFLMKDGIFKDCNQKTLVMFGVERDEIVGHSPSEFSPPVQPDGKSSVEKAAEKINAALAGKPQIFEWQHQKLDGTVFATEVNLNRVELANGPHLLAMVQDISWRKEAEGLLRESEERFRTLAEMLPEAIFETDVELKISYANRKAFELFGYMGSFPENGLHILDLIVSEDRERARGNIEERIQGKKRAAAKYHALRKDGTAFPVLIHANDVRKDGEVVGLRGVLVDLSEREQVEAEILKLRKLESVGVLAGGIAHDFNNLLTGIFGNLEMAKMFLSPEHKSYSFLETASQSMENATNLTKQLLTFAKGGEPVKEVLDIGRIIVETAQFSLRGSKVGLQTRIAPDLLPVEADKGQLNQVITNLVINAQQAMPTGGVIVITAENVDISGLRQVKITVQDEGVGIASQYLDKIFDPYFSTKQQGSGLGLASVHSIIVKHGGTIKVDSVLNRGTTFTIHLPATEKKEEKTGGELTAKTDAVLEANVRVLIMDDEEVVREVVGEMLEVMGHEVVHAVDGREAVEKYRQAWDNNNPYDVVIMDLTVPGGMGGQEAAENILKIDPQAVMIVSSGYSTDPVMARYEEYGFKGRVGKPYRFAALQAVILEVLKNSKEKQ